MSKDEQHDLGTIRSKATMKKNRNTRQMLAVKLNSIRNMMLNGANNAEIMAAMNIPQRTFYRYMDKIYQEDRIELAKRNKETLATHLSLLRERLMQSIRNCQNMAQDPGVPAKARIDAERLKIDASIAIARLEREGTTITQISQYGHEENTNRNNLELVKNYCDGDNILHSDKYSMS
jgi:hypothetical protein